MQTLSEIKGLLAGLGVRPSRALGQNFLIDRNLMGKLIELADPGGGDTILEVGAAMGSLTEELADRAGRVVAVEMDGRLTPILTDRLGHRENVTIVAGDVLAGKHAISPEVLAELAGAESVQMVSNLPYSVAVPVIANCLLSSWLAVTDPAAGAVRFDRLTFTVQRELADRLVAPPGCKQYGPASVIASLLSHSTPGRPIPPTAFWPRPKVNSQMLRLDFDGDLAARLSDAAELSRLLSATFGHRRKKLSAGARGRGFPYDRQAFLAALAAAGVDEQLRPEQVAPEGFLEIANVLQQTP